MRLQPATGDIWVTHVKKSGNKGRSHGRKRGSAGTVLKQLELFWFWNYHSLQNQARGPSAKPHVKSELTNHTQIKYLQKT